MPPPSTLLFTRQEIARLLGLASGGPGFPAAYELLKGTDVLGPIMERSRVEVRAIRPDQRVHLGINPHLFEELRVAERSEELAR